MNYIKFSIFLEFILKLFDIMFVYNKKADYFT